MVSSYCKITKVTASNNFAISSDGIATALQDSASSLVAANNSYQQAVALIAAANRVVQDPNSVGAALRTISLRLRGTSTKELSDAGEDTEGAITSKSKLRTKVKALSGVDILTDTGAYKSTYDILLEISKVWKDMSDINQAALLEIIAGKTRSNTAAAILSNQTDLEKAYVQALQAEGSALEENEKYLDSIQGRIDLFNNAVQTMWNNTLDSDVVKWFVNLGTEIVKVVDKLGLIPSVLAAIGTFKGLGSVFGLFKESGITIDSITKKLTSYLFGIKATTDAEMQLTQVQLIKKLTTQGLTEENAKAIVTATGLGVSTDKLTKETLAAAMATKGYSQEQINATTAKIFGTAVTEKSARALLTETIQRKLQSSILVKYAINMGLVSAANVGTMTTTQLLGLSFKALGVAIWNATKAMTAFLLTNPIGWAILAVAAIAAVVAVIISTTKSTEDLKKELDDLNSEINTMKSDLESLNSELKTTQDRMAELLAMDHLSFTESEELQNLQLQNAELERQIELEEQLLKNKQEQQIAKVKEILDKTFYNEGYGKDDYAIDGSGVITHDSFWKKGISGKEALDIGIDKYKQSKEEYDALNQAYITVSKNKQKGEAIDEQALAILKDALPKNDNTLFLREADSSNVNAVNGILEASKLILERKENTLLNQKSGITMVLSEMSDLIKENGLSYALGDEDINKFLDEYYAYSIKFQNAQGAASKSSVISAIFDQTANESIKELKKELDGIANSDLDRAAKIKEAQQKIDDALKDETGAYQRLQAMMNTVGVTAEELADYFIAASEAPDINTIEGVSQVYQDAIDIIGKYQTAESDVLGKDEEGLGVTWDNLFTQDNSGRWVADKLKVASILEGSDENIRAEFTKIAEAVRNGEMEVEDAIQKLQFSGLRQVLDIEIKELSEANIDIFPDLKEDIEGIIDTFNELSKAVGGTVDALDTLKQARAEEAYSGSVSIETLEKLMQYTDDYSKIISIDETGAIHLATDAEDILIETRLEKIKQDANAALSEAELAYQEALHTQQTVTETGPAQETLQGVINQVGGAIAFVTSLWSDLTSGNWAGSWDRARQARESAIAKNESAYANMEEEANANLAEAAENLKKAQDNANIANSLTKDNIKRKVSSDVASGGANTPEEVAENAFQKAMDYWENQISANQAKYEQIQNEIDLIEKKGGKAGKEYYEEQIRLENERLGLLEQQKADAQKYLKELEDAGKTGDDTWWEVANTLNDLENELDDVMSSIQDLNDAIAEVDLYVFEETHNRFKNLIDDLDTIRDLIAQNSEEDWFDDEGMWTEKGVAVLGTYIQQYEMYQKALDKINEELAKYQDEYAGHEADYAKLGIDSEQELYDKRRDLIDQQYEYAKAINDTENSVKDAYEAQIDAIEDWENKAVDAYNDYIDVVKESLSAERDLYEFKKNTTEKTKNIAQLERRIASLAGADDAASIAERKKLQAELTDAKTDLEDHYYTHSMDAREQALDDEAQAYEKSMNNYIEKLRDMLDEATSNMETFMQSVTNAVMLNADAVKKEYDETGVAIDGAIISPWDEAIEKIKGFEKNGLSLMDAWTTEEGVFGKFESNATDMVSSPWSAGTEAANTFVKNVKSAMEDVVTQVSTNVAKAKESLSDLTDTIKTTNVEYTPPKDTDPTPDSNPKPNSPQAPEQESHFKGSYKDVKMLKEILKTVFGQNVKIDGLYDNNTIAAVKKMQQELQSAGLYSSSIDGKYGPGTSDALQKYVNSNIRQASMQSDQREKWFNGKAVSFFRGRSAYVPSSFYAKGTLGTKRDEFAITDESWIGEEITLAAGKNGQLQYLKKGSAVMPADISANLVEWGKLNPNMLNMPGVGNGGVSVISNAINKPELNFNVEKFLSIDKVDEGCLPEVKKFVQQELDNFVRKLNYSLKGIGAR